MQGLRREMTRLDSPARLLLGALLDIVFPPRCHCCKSTTPSGAIHICSDCLQKMEPLVSPLCPVCGIPFLTEGGIDHSCSSCAMDHPPFAAARAPFMYDGPVKQMIHHFKYERKIALRRPLALLVARHLEHFAAEAAPNLVIPVPLHPKRLRQRGYNQAVLLGETVARQWRLPFCRTNLRRIRWTEPQIELPATERLRNVKGAFAVADPSRLRGKRVLLIDDVYTTGATVMECSRTLRRAGAIDVFVATVARAVRQ
jgi:ComF family protein